MKPNIDMEAYFDRIVYQGSRTATLDTLCELHKRHTRMIPFENLNPLLGLPVKLDLQSFQQKLLYDNRGGYCFEQNLLFRHVLEALGFSVTGLAARVLWNQPEDQITLRSHMLLLVTVDETEYIVDVSFGGQTPTTPLLLESRKVQETPHEPLSLIKRRGDYYILQTQIRNEWKPLYRFDLQEQFLLDYEVYNWYVSSHPESHFVTGLIASRPDNQQNCRYILHNNTFTIHHMEGKTRRQTLTNAGELRNILEKVFLLRLPEVGNLMPTLKNITTPKAITS